MTLLHLDYIDGGVPEIDGKANAGREPQSIFIILGLDPRIHAVTSAEGRNGAESGALQRLFATAWIPGSPRRSFAPASPWNDEPPGMREVETQLRLPVSVMLKSTMLE
jgi:hypothetical protein